MRERERQRGGTTKVGDEEENGVGRGKRAHAKDGFLFCSPVVSLSICSLRVPSLAPPLIKLSTRPPGL